MNMRKERGLEIAKSCKNSERNGYYLVPSQTEPTKSYRVRLGKTVYCNCPDFAKRGEDIGRCKHIFAVEIRHTEQKDNYGNTISTTTTKVTYSQDWNAYDRSQTTEKETFMKMMDDLCGSVEQPRREGAGRPSLPLRDMVFASALKVFTNFSLRRFMSDVRVAKEKGYMVVVPHYSRVARYMESEKMTPILHKMIQVTSSPLSSVEENFAVDSSGFSTGVFSRWYDFRFGRSKEVRQWVKAHICVGVKTNVVTAVKLTEAHGSDSKEFIDLVKKTGENFKIGEVSADKAYSSKDNLKAVEDAGGQAFIPFRKNTSGSRGGSLIWKKMWHYYQLNQEGFMAHYHKRSNVETTFSMIKRKFGNNVRSKTKTAQINEVLLKILCHNICVVIQETNELGINFKTGVAH